ncbi:peptidylprolyl isomerase [Yeosuana sp. MJ-SS3]|uniref:peptidylprolyl isomerase n=1 Tax=Gilvirhabdus luticola TaxID=3079858 RepID=A0ABU3U917_9FLAO|nr:peptidylprolyl isomerase [Yeosuana sp. MJ-SS3]MDU8886575.1 peptidylprolyl isomerase [Yeosuana sp. MJ-SS3]
MNIFKNVMKSIALILLMTLSSCQEKYADLDDGIYAEIVTNKGTMVAKLFYDKTPVTVANFVSLAEGTNTMVDSVYKGKNFYEGIIFHRVIDSFMIQGGDPTGTGSGSPGYRFMDEFSPDLKHDKPGILSMANSGPATNGSQFFVTEVPTPHLNNRHSVFGELVLGLDVLDTISNVETSQPGNKPVEDITINQLNIIRKGSDAKAFDAANTFKNHFAEAERREKERKEKEEAIIKMNKEKFNEQEQNATTLPSGLQFTITEKGSGEKLPSSAKVLTHYAVYFDNGKLLETSKLDVAEANDVVNQARKDAGQYQPIPADISPDAQMIPGFKEGLQQLSVGDKATLFVPYHLAYGEAGNRGIPPKSDLIFEVEIVELVK